MSLPEAIRAGAREFNAGKYFEAHEAWEEHWGLGSEAERRATLGLIKAAVALHHLKNGNAAGFLWQAERAVTELRAGTGVWPELDLAGLTEAFDSLLAEARFHKRVPSELPKLGFASTD